MNKRIILFLISMLLLANFSFADDYPDVYVTGDNVSTNLEIASVWNANLDPLFILSSSFKVSTMQINRAI